MEAIELYLPLRTLHIVAVIVSGGLFAVRGAAALAGQRWPLRRAVRRASYAIDSLLLGAALALLAVLGLNPFAVPWLAVKLVLLLTYILLAYGALHALRGLPARVVCYLAALAAFAGMLAVARSHHPLGALAAWAG